jgi:hypothetical protein
MPGERAERKAGRADGGEPPRTRSVRVSGRGANPRLHLRACSLLYGLGEANHSMSGGRPTQTDTKRKRYRPLDRLWFPWAGHTGGNERAPHHLEQIQLKRNDPSSQGVLVPLLVVCPSARHLFLLSFGFRFCLTSLWLQFSLRLSLGFGFGFRFGWRGKNVLAGQADHQEGVRGVADWRGFQARIGFLPTRAWTRFSLPYGLPDGTTSCQGVGLACAWGFLRGPTP